MKSPGMMPLPKPFSTKASGLTIDVRMKAADLPFRYLSRSGPTVPVVSGGGQSVAGAAAGRAGEDLLAGGDDGGRGRASRGGRAAVFAGGVFALVVVLAGGVLRSRSSWPAASCRPVASCPPACRPAACTRNRLGGDELRQEGLVLGGRHDVDGRAHQGVAEAAELGADDVVGAEPRRRDPEACRDPRHRVLLEAEGRDPEAVEDVAGVEAEADRLVPSTGRGRRRRSSSPPGVRGRVAEGPGELLGVDLDLDLVGRLVLDVLEHHRSVDHERGDERRWRPPSR